MDRITYSNAENRDWFELFAATRDLRLAAPYSVHNPLNLSRSRHSVIADHALNAGGYFSMERLTGRGNGLPDSPDLELPGEREPIPVDDVVVRPSLDGVDGVHYPCGLGYGRGIAHEPAFLDGLAFQRGALGRGL